MVINHLRQYTYLLGLAGFITFYYHIYQYNIHPFPLFLGNKRKIKIVGGEKERKLQPKYDYIFLEIIKLPEIFIFNVYIYTCIYILSFNKSSIDLLQSSGFFLFRC